MAYRAPIGAYRRERTPPPIFPAVDDNLRQKLSAMYGAEVSEYDDLDIETLLGKLSAQELEDLNNDYDPDNSLLPPSERCRGASDKEPTGKFNRAHLLEYLEEQAKNDADWEESVPYTPGQKRGKEFSPGLKQAQDEPEEPAIELDLAPSEDDEIDEAMQGEVDESDLVDLAGLLGMHAMLSQPQYYNALKLKPQDESTGRTFSGVVPAAVVTPIADEPPNSTDVEECIRKLEGDDADCTDVNINNMKHISRERIIKLIDAARRSSHVEKLSMCNIAMTDKEAQGIVPLLEQNSSLTSISLESNFISPDMLAKILRASIKNQKLVELHAENQRSQVLGNQVEMDMMQAVEDSDSLLRVGITFNSMEARNRVSEALERNYERLRLKRLEANKKA